MARTRPPGTRKRAKHTSTTRKDIDTKFDALRGNVRSASMHLYETHIPVADTKIAESFYCEIVGLGFAYRDPTRDIVFLWADTKEKAMIGLWGPNTVYGKQDGIAQKRHLAFAVSLDQLIAAIEKLNQNGIDTFGFGGNKTDEPTVIGWMPSAQIYFRDPDGHMLEFITILPDPPNPNFNGPHSEWKKLTTRPY
jgi:lactoylglutathione lyase